MMLFSHLLIEFFRIGLQGRRFVVLGNSLVSTTLTIHRHAHKAIGDSSLSKKLQVVLLHCRLGHPSLGYMKRLFPSLLKKK